MHGHTPRAFLSLAIAEPPCPRALSSYICMITRTCTRGRGCSAGRIPHGHRSRSRALAAVARRQGTDRVRDLDLDLDLESLVRIRSETCRMHTYQNKSNYFQNTGSPELRKAVLCGEASKTFAEKLFARVTRDFRLFRSFARVAQFMYKALATVGFYVLRKIIPSRPKFENFGRLGPPKPTEI